MKLQELFQETQEMCSDECCGVPANECHCPPDCPHCSCNAPGGPGPKAEPIEEGVNDPNIFKAVFMAGGPGAGKSYIAQKLTGGTGLKTVNSDIAFKWLMDKANLRLDMPDDEKEERDQVRDRAKEIAGKQEALYLQGRLGLLIDGTGKDIQKISAINTKLKVYGYETKMVFVNTDLETSLMRNQERAKQGDRTVDPAIAKDAWSKVQNLSLIHI